jgi:hypothetical protein
LAGAGITAIALAADLFNAGSPRGIGPRQVSLALSGIAVFLAGIVLISSARQRYISEWLLVGLATITVAFAADLLVINGLPEFGAKQMVLASLSFSALLATVAPASAAGRPDIGEWLTLIRRDWLEISRFLSVTVQLGLLVLVISQFQLSSTPISLCRASTWRW